MEDSSSNHRNSKSNSIHSSTHNSHRQSLNRDGCPKEESAADVSHKLDFHNIPFFGCQQEIQQLRDAYQHHVVGHQRQKKRIKAGDDDNSTSSGSSSSSTPDERVSASSTITKVPAVFVWGLSGTGKSRLVNHFVEELKTAEKGKHDATTPYIIQGKHDESTGIHDPFSAIFQALDDFCQQVQAEPFDERNRIRTSIKQALGEEQTKVMAKLFPSVKNLLLPLPIATTSAQQHHNDHHTGTLDLVNDTEKSYFSSQRSFEHQPDDPTSMAMMESTDTAWNRLQYTFVTFVQAIATKQRPIIMFLDDLQWSSQVSMDLLTTLLSNKDLKHFLLIGSIRQELDLHSNQVLELDAKLPIRLMLQTLRQLHPISNTESNDDSHNDSHNDTQHSNDDGSYDTRSSDDTMTPDDDLTINTSQPWTDINLTNMSIIDIGFLLSSLLDRDSEEVRPLTSKIYRKTQGNVLFTLHLLEQLERCHVLVYNHISFQWEWKWSDDDSDGSLGKALAGADDVLKLVAMKIKQLPAELRTALTIAAYIRSSFDLKVLQLLLETESKHIEKTPSDFVFLNDVTSHQALAVLLERAVLDGLLSNTIGGTTYKFGHDRIQQAARGLVPFGEARDALRQRIGRTLLDFCQAANGTAIAVGDVDPNLIFVAADHLNNGPTKDHLASVRMNLEVGKRAMEMAALAPAAAYLQLASNAFQKLRNPWEEQYDLALKLHQVRANVELSLNHFDLGFELSNEYLGKAQTLMEKLPMRLSMASALGRQDKQHESLALSRSAAQLLGAYPRRALAGHLLKELVSLKIFFRRVSDETMLTSPFMTDPANLLAVKFLTEIVHRGYSTNNLVEYMLAAIKIIRLTFKSGIVEQSALGFAVYGLVSGLLGDPKTANRFSKLAKQVLSRTKAKSIAGIVQVVCCVFVDGWTQPTPQIIQGLRSGHSASMEIGDFESGFNCWAACNVFVYWDGCPLAMLNASYTSLLNQMALYKIDSHIGMALEHADLVQMMTKKKAIDWEEVRSYGSRVVDDDHDILRLISGNWVRIHLAVWFLQYETAEYLIEGMARLADKETAYQFVSTRQLHNGLMAAGRYRQTGKRKYLRQVRRALNASQRMCDRRGTNVLSQSSLLKAELHSLTTPTSQWKDVKPLYDVTIGISMQGNYINKAALSCELAGEYLLRCGKDDLAGDYLTKAWGYYKQWGALAKAGDLEERRGQNVDPSRFEIINVGIYVGEEVTMAWRGCSLINGEIESNVIASSHKSVHSGNSADPLPRILAEEVVDMTPS